MKKIITIDGATGEGGGQIVRTSLALSLVTGNPLRLINIRAGRKNPGLLRQHLTAVRAACAVGDAVVDGAETGSTELIFRPETIRPGRHQFAIGTAGSTTLVLQTLLPALIRADAPSLIRCEGGTHNPFAPSFDFFSKTFLPQLAKFGPQVEACLIRPGFFPAGGGAIEITVTPVVQLQQINLQERGPARHSRVEVHLAALSPRIAERALARIAKRLPWDPANYVITEHPETCGPGFVITTEVASEKIVETFTGHGEKGLRVEQVADATVDPTRHYLAHTAPVGHHLADQLLLPLALAGGGSFRTVGLSRHARTNIAVIEQFLPVRFQTMEDQGTTVTLE